MSMKHDRQRMIDDIELEVEYTRNLIGREHLDPKVMSAMRDVPREKFVPPEMQYAAFENGPLPIGHGQTISQPYIVALMTDMLNLQPDCRVLEIGTGSGYQTAILSQLCKKVYTVEVVPELGEDAKRLFRKLGYHNVEARTGNGYNGWPEHAPYEGIIVTAAAPYIPMTLVEQLKPNGRLVIPVGPPHSHQELMLVEKEPQGGMRTRSVLGVAFVPMVESAPDDY